MTTQKEHTDTICVLHVDDQLDFAEMTTAFLEREDDRFETEIVTSASDGLARLADSPFDCIISDYDMPAQNGIEFLKTVRKEYPGLPFILYTGKGSEEVASEAISAGVTDYLQKSPGTEQYELLTHRIINAVDYSQAQQWAQEEQQRAQEEQQRFEALFNRLSQPVVEVQYEADEPIITQVNSTFEDVFGYEATTLVGNSLDTYIIPDDRMNEAKAINQRIQADNRLKSRQVIRETANGLGKFLIQIAVYDHRSGGFIIYTDITDRSKQTETLERNRDLLRHTEQVADIGGWEADIETGEIRWTEGTYVIHDIDPDGDFEPSIETGVEFYIPDDQAKIESALNNCRTHGDPYDLELRLITAEDDEKWVRTTGKPVYDSDDIVKLRGAIRDITETRGERQELVELKQEYQTLVENFPSGVVSLIDENLEYVRFRGDGLERVSVSPADVEGHVSHDVFPDEVADELCQQYEQAFNGIATTVEQEYRGERYRVRVTPVRNEKKEITYVMAVAQNITEQSENRQRLQRQNKRLDEFVSVVSHDLRSPLSVARGNLELLRNGYDNNRIDTIDSALTRMDELIGNLLNLARADEQMEGTESVNLAELSQSCWQNVETTDATIHIDLTPTQSIKANSNRLAQLLENLMRNAIDHSGENEDVTVTVGELEGGFYVEDDGNGIPANKRDDIFEAGYTTTERGTGFGLSIVKQVTEAHGWEISLTEGSEGGARFVVSDVEVSQIESG
ncbi:MAG: signal transduction histidine kinase [Haloquadratum sp. J07HQX50]|nr:MAG: signal transduction histidine kinase [Haloquadratum sp. J07HQX50]